MSETSSQTIIERFFAALNDSDMDALLALLSEDVALDTRSGSREIGKEQFHWTVSEAKRHFRERYTDVTIMLAPGGVRAAAEFTLSGTYLSTKDGLPEASGQSYSVPAGMFFEIDDGFITRVTMYLNAERWRAALQSTGHSPTP